MNNYEIVSLRSQTDTCKISMIKIFCFVYYNVFNFVRAQDPRVTQCDTLKSCVHTHVVSTGKPYRNK